MNRTKAKLLTLGGVGCCSISVILLIGIITVKIDFSPLFATLFFGVGIVLIVLSLAYYTEK